MMNTALKFGLGTALIALTLWIVSLFAPRQCHVPSDLVEMAEHIIQIREVLDTQMAAWNQGDIDGFMAHYVKSDGLRFASGGNVETGWTQTLARYQRRYPDAQAMGQLSFTDRDIEVLSPTDALIFGRWTLTRKADTPTGLFTLHMKLIDKKWIIASDHTSSAN